MARVGKLTHMAVTRLRSRRDAREQHGLEAVRDMLLEGHGYRVLGPASTVAEALRLLAAERPDVALLDVNLRGETVTPVAEALRTRGVPFVLASAYEARSSRRRSWPGRPAWASLPPRDACSPPWRGPCVREGRKCHRTRGSHEPGQNNTVPI